MTPKMSWGGFWAKNLRKVEYPGMRFQKPTVPTLWLECARGVNVLAVNVLAALNVLEKVDVLATPPCYASRPVLGRMCSKW